MESISYYNKDKVKGILGVLFEEKNQKNADEMGCWAFVYKKRRGLASDGTDQDVASLHG